jgi:hypothetical protein
MTEGSLRCLANPSEKPARPVLERRRSSLVRQATMFCLHPLSWCTNINTQKQPRPSVRTRGVSANHPPNCPPTNVLLVLKMKFLAKIYALLIKEMARAAWFGNRRFTRADHVYARVRVIPECLYQESSCSADDPRTVCAWRRLWHVVAHTSACCVTLGELSNLFWGLSGLGNGAPRY